MLQKYRSKIETFSAKKKLKKVVKFWICNFFREIEVVKIGQGMWENSQILNLNFFREIEVVKNKTAKNLSFFEKLECGKIANFGLEKIHRSNYQLLSLGHLDKSYLNQLDYTVD